jgi:hypothetical protein
MLFFLICHAFFSELSLVHLCLTAIQDVTESNQGLLVCRVRPFVLSWLSDLC